MIGTLRLFSPPECIRVNIKLFYLADSSSALYTDVQFPQVRRLRQYSKESMAAAIDAVRSGRMRKSQAATFFGVPRTTLLDKLAGRTPETYHSPLNRRLRPSP